MRLCDCSALAVLAGSAFGATGTAVAHAAPPSVDEVYVSLPQSTPPGLVSIAQNGGSAQAVDGTWSEPLGLATDAAGDLYVVSVDLDAVTRYPAGGGAGQLIGASIENPSDVVVGTDGDVFVSDVQAGTISRIPADGGPTVAAVTGLADPDSFAIGADGAFLVALSGTAPDTGSLESIDADGTRTTLLAPLSYPQSVAVSAPAPVFLDSVPPREATVGQPYSFLHGVEPADRGIAPRFRVASGALPPGLSLNSATGALGGVPTTAGTYTFAVQVENAATAVVSDTAVIEVTEASAGGPGTALLAESGATPAGGAVVLGALACASGAGALLIARRRRPPSRRRTARTRTGA